MPDPQPSREKPSHRSEVRAMLLLHDAGSMAGSMGRLIKGIAFCLIFGIVLAFILKFGVGSEWLGFKLWLIIYLAVLAGILVWLERRPRTQNLNSPGATFSESGLGKVVSKIFWGPQAILDGLRGVRNKRTVLQEAMFDRAAVLVLDLAQTDGGVPIAQLLHPPDDMRAFGSAVDWLDANDWMGKSSDGGSLWLSSTARKKLVAQKITFMPGPR